MAMHGNDMMYAGRTLRRHLLFTTQLSQRSNSIFNLPAFMHGGLSTESFVSSVCGWVLKGEWRACEANGGHGCM